MEPSGAIRSVRGFICSLRSAGLRASSSALMAVTLSRAALPQSASRARAKPGDAVREIGGVREGRTGREGAVGQRGELIGRDRELSARGAAVGRLDQRAAQQL